MYLQKCLVFNNSQFSLYFKLQATFGNKINKQTYFQNMHKHVRSIRNFKNTDIYFFLLFFIIIP